MTKTANLRICASVANGYINTQNMVIARSVVLVAMGRIGLVEINVIGGQERKSPGWTRKCLIVRQSYYGR